MSHRSTGWKPGETRSYIPVVTFDRPENTPVGGILGKVHDINGSQRVSFITHGKKTQSTK